MVLKVIVVEINNFMDVWPPHVSKRPLSLISLQAVARFPFNSKDRQDVLSFGQRK